MKLFMEMDKFCWIPWLKNKGKSLCNCSNVLARMFIM